MFERFTERARQVVVLAQDEARALRHNYIGTEHILLGLLREEEGLAARVLESLDITVEEVRAQVARIVGKGDAVASGQIPFTPRAKKVLELSLREALSFGHNYVGTEHILLGLVRENEGVAARVLLDFDADDEKIRDEIVRMISGPNYSPSSNVPVWSPRPVRRGLLKWEYQVLSLPSDAHGRQEELTELGRQGWQLVTVVPSDGGLHWVFQRPPGSDIGRDITEQARLVAQRAQVAQEIRARTIKDFRVWIVVAKERALTDNDSERASLIDGLEHHFNRLFDRTIKDIGSATGADPDESPDVISLVAQVEDGTLTVGTVVDLVARAKEAAIEAQQFERAAQWRVQERELVNLLTEIRQITQTDPPAVGDE